jgi:hypothetical protein
VADVWRAWSLVTVARASRPPSDARVPLMLILTGIVAIYSAPLAVTCTDQCTPRNAVIIAAAAGWFCPGSAPPLQLRASSLLLLDTES